MRITGKSDIGKVRSANQDDYRYGRLGDGSVGYAIVCDGMGGHKAGHVASELACLEIETRLKKEYSSDMPSSAVRSMIMGAVAGANEVIYERSSRDPMYEGMGTTVVVALLAHSVLHIAHVGDSRAYIINSHEFAQLTRDHSMVQELVEAGKITDEDAKHHPQKNLITRAVGVRDKIQVDYLETVLNPQDRILICTDGLTNACEEEKIHQTVMESPYDDAPKQLIDLANEGGGPDNITVVLITEAMEDE